MPKLIVPEKELLKKRKVNNDKLKKCPECHKVWERHYQTKTILRYIDFPAFDSIISLSISKNAIRFSEYKLVV